MNFQTKNLRKATIKAVKIKSLKDFEASNKRLIFRKRGTDQDAFEDYEKEIKILQHKAHHYEFETFHSSRDSIKAHHYELETFHSSGDSIETDLFSG